MVGCSTSPSLCSSYQPSPCASYNPSPALSSFASPASSSYITNACNAINVFDGNSLIPQLKNLSSAFSASSKFPQHHLYMHGGSISAPVTPPLSSPPSHTPRFKTDWDDPAAQPSWGSANHTFLLNSMPPSPGRKVITDPAWLVGIQLPTGGPLSPTVRLVSANPFGFFKEAMADGGSSRVVTPGQSGTCSPLMPRGSGCIDVPMSDGTSDEFAFGSNGNCDHPPAGLVKAWEGERIHEVCGSDELELTLGSSCARIDA